MTMTCTASHSTTMLHATIIHETLHSNIAEKVLLPLTLSLVYALSNRHCRDRITNTTKLHYDITMRSIHKKVKPQ
jgi:hypothetical protein